MRIEQKDPFVKILMLKGDKGDPGGGTTDYNDLINKPTKLSDFTNDGVFITNVVNDLTNYYNKTSTDSLLSTKVDKSAIVQALGDSATSVMSQNAITENLNGKADKTDLNNYYNKSETYTQSEIDDKITRIPQFNIQVVDELPTTNISTTTVYVVPSSVGGEDIYREYIYANNEWKLLGSQTVDLSDYYTKTSTDSLLSNKVDKSAIVQSTGNSTTSVMSQDAVTDSLDAKFDKSSIVQTAGNSTTSVMSQNAVTTQLNSKADSGSLSTVATSGSYNDLSNKPTKLSDFTNDGVFITNATNNLTNYYNKTQTDSLLSNKVDKITGKGLSTEDFTSAEKTKLANIATEANKTVVVQTTGNSTTSVMSQDAVTNQLGNKANVSALNDYYNKASVNSLLSGKMNDIGFITGQWTPEFKYFDPNTESTGSLQVSYQNRAGQFTVIGDLCFINFYIFGTFTSTPTQRAIVAGLPYVGAPGIETQVVSLGVFVARHGNSITWTPTASVAARIEEGKDYILLTQHNGYELVSWPNNTTDTFYVAASGVYKINHD